MKEKHGREKKISAKNLAVQKSIRKLKTLLAILIVLFAFILYSQSINHNYTLDDHTVLDENNIVTKGIDGIPTILKTDYWYGAGHDDLRGPVYRPTSLIIFAIAWEFFPNDLAVYHFISIFFYVVTCLMLFLVLCKLFEKQNLIFPFVCTLLYTAHPIHTEVVNSIKSLDEILCFLFGIISIWYLLKYTATHSKTAFIAGGISFFLALLSKETSIAFLIIIPLTVYFFTDNNKRSIISISILLAALTVIWLLLRTLIFKALPENDENTQSVLNNTLNAAPDFAGKYATAFYILLRYLALLIFPHPLSSDYNFAYINIQTMKDPGALIGLVLYAVLGIYALVNIRKKNIIAFGILVYLISLAPVSNIFFLVGATMAERFMYMPSLGFCFVLSYFLIKICKTESIKWKGYSFQNFFSANLKLLVFVAIIISLYAAKTIDRSKDWKDNITLLSQDVQVAENSARANQILGSALLVAAQKSPNPNNRTDTFNLAKKFLRRSAEIYPDYYASLSHLGVIYLFEQKLDSADYYLAKGREKNPNDIDVNFNYGILLIHLKRYDEAIRVLNHLISLQPGNANAYYNLAVAYDNKGDIENALINYLKVTEMDSNNANAHYNASRILRVKGNIVKADEFMNKAISLGYKSQ